MAVHQLFEEFKKDHHSIRRECCEFLLFSNIVLDLLFLSLQLSVDLSLFQKLSPGFQFYTFHLRTFFMECSYKLHAQTPICMTRISIFVWVINFDLSGIGGPTLRPLHLSGSFDHTSPTTT